MAGLRVIELDGPPDDFLPGEPEGAAFHKAFQSAEIEGFDCRYLAFMEGDTRIAVAPYFLGTFNLGTMLPPGILKNILAKVQFRYACVGHPSSDIGQIDGAISAKLLDLLNDTLSRKAQLVAYKGFPDDLPLPGFVSVRGLPACVLNIRGDYLSMLNAHRRTDLRHKLHAADALRREEYRELPEHLLGEIYRLYLDTLNRSPIRFEVLTPEYFRQVEGLGRFHLYFEGERLIGFIQILISGNKASLKYMGMDHQRNRPYYLYFAMCVHAIKACEQAGCTHIELGVSSYHAKLLMGCELVETHIYYRHNRPSIHWLLGKLKFLLEPTADELG